MTAAEISALLILATATSFTPGPNTTLSTALAANRGLRGALHFVLAVPVGWGLLFTLTAVGMGSLVMAVPALRWAIVLGGVGYLLWLARRLWNSGQLSQADQNRMDVSFVQGVLLQFLNIKAWMLALSIVGGWVAGKPDAISRYLQTLPLMLFFAFSSNFTYALVGSVLRHWLAQGQRLQAFNRLMALVLTATAGWIAWSLSAAA
ncbi:MAG: LysE family translocator [Limnohabitans sp.]|jgi:threonine/homoserine/homoserine lactone efflux protein|nr:MAG: LysE family translocator [Limnohabitans sp.]